MRQSASAKVEDEHVPADGVMGAAIAEAEHQKLTVKDLTAVHGCLIIPGDPKTAKWTRKWDLTMVLALLFTAIITPVEVAFLDEGEHITVLWWINRGVDLCFLLDMIISFNMAYQERNTGTWVYRRSEIARHYLLGWFTIDFFSVLPFFLISLDYCDPWGSGATCEDASGNGGGLDNPSVTRSVVLVRLVKMLRMLKLSRIFKASRVIERNLLDIALYRWEMTYSSLKIVKLCVFLLFFAHLQACMWGLGSTWTAAPNWIEAFDATFTESEVVGETPHPLDRYVAALYWSVMTLTSIGYGEMTPLNTIERILCSIWMFVSGVVWTYGIGMVAAIATTLNPNQIQHENTMDALNYFMRERQLPYAMRMTLRDFFAASRLLNQVQDDAELLDKMSPLLQGSVALAANKTWIDQIWFFRSLEATRSGIEFIASLAKALVIRNYVAKERLPVGQLYILRKGMVVKMWRFLGCRKVWGEDMILDTVELIDHAQAVALTYVEVFTLRRLALDSLLAESPVAHRAVYKAARRITLQRSLLKYLCSANGKTGPCSFIMKSQAQGAEVVDDRLSVEQQVKQTTSKVESIHKMLALNKLLGSKHLEADKEVMKLEEAEGNDVVDLAVGARLSSVMDGVNRRSSAQESDSGGTPAKGGSFRRTSKDGVGVADLAAMRTAMDAEFGVVKADVGTLKAEMAEVKRMLQRLLDK